MTARSVINSRIEGCRQAEDLLRQMGRADLADQVASIRRGYSSAIETCRRLYADNKALRDQQSSQTEAAT
jgi:hypothetical protein